MITPEVESAQDARADFEELEHTGHVLLIGSHGLAGRSCILRARDGERVLIMQLSGLLPPEVAESVVWQLGQPVAQWDGMTGTHLILYADGVQPGFLEALDAEAVDWKITYRLPEKLDVDIEEAVEAVPLGEHLGPVPMVLSVGEEDFSRLVSSSGPVLSEYLGRMKALGEEEVLRADWSMLYFFSDSWVRARMAMAFLEGHGIAYQMMEDAGDGEFGVLTNFVSAQAAREIARRDLREVLKRGKVKSMDEALMDLLHPPGDGDDHDDCSEHGE